jgi:hypothetical protein
LTNKDWIVEQVKVIPIDDGQLKNRKKYISYMIYRNNSYENSTSFILDLKLNRKFNPNILIEYDDNESKIKTIDCLFYTGSVRHWGESNSMIAISICSGLVSNRYFHSNKIIFII